MPASGPSVTGAVEATAMGNLLVQVRASGELSSLAEMREVVRRSSDVATCRPGKSAAWEEASGRFAELRRRK
jgi:rhamnulokinase